MNLGVRTRTTDAPASGTLDAPSQAIRGTAILGLRQLLVGLITVSGLIALPLLLGPADFSLYGYVNMIILLGAAVGDLGLGAYLIKHEVSHRQLRGMLGLQLVFWLGAGVALLLTGVIINPFGFSSVTYFLLCTGLFFFALQSLPTALLEKRHSFRQISTLEVTQRVLLMLLAILFAVADQSQWVIPFAALVAAVLLYPAFMRMARWPGLPLLLKGEPLFTGFASEWWQTRIASQLAYAVFPLLGGLLFSTEKVGLLIWALSISLIPGYIAPMAARAVYPVMAKSRASERIAIHEPVLRGLILLAAPIIVFMFITAPPLTEAIFGAPWTDAVPSLQILLLTCLLGVALSVTIPLAFLEGPANRVKWLSVFSTTLIYILGISLSNYFALLSIPIASFTSGFVLLIVIDLTLRRSRSYSPLRICLPAAFGLVVGLIVGMALSSLLGGGLAVAVGAGALAMAIQIPITWLLGGGISLAKLRRQVALLRPR